MALSPKEMHDRIIENLEAKTGRAFEYWRRVVNAERGDKSNKDLIAHLKAGHGLGHYTAVAVIKQASTGNDYDEAKDLVATLFAGKPKAQTLYKALDAKIMALPGVERVPCKTYVGYRAKTQFLIVAPTKDEALRCGLSLSPEETKLAPAKNFGSARIKSQFDSSVKGATPKQESLIEAAYHQNV